MNGIMRDDQYGDLIIKITPNEHGKPAGRLADVELHLAGRSPLAGLKLIGLAFGTAARAARYYPRLARTV
jgi:hypothetical protein